MRANKFQSMNRRSSPGTYCRKSANSTLWPLRLLRRSPFMRPMKILRDTSSSCSRRARNWGSNRGGGVSGIIKTNHENTKGRKHEKVEKELEDDTFDAESWCVEV